MVFKLKVGCAKNEVFLAVELLTSRMRTFM